ncbi:uncharacterized protein TNCV_2974191 [Trichonephila clavipes]|nr:uncharacterized protein TNCV_2974191 [Trichonephila clavipes]
MDTAPESLKLEVIDLKSDLSEKKMFNDMTLAVKNLCQQKTFHSLKFFFEPSRRIGRKHIFCDRSKDVKLLYEDDLRQTIFSSIDRVTAEIRVRFQQLQNLAQKYAFLRPEVILSMDELNLDQAHQGINKEFQLGQETQAVKKN